MSNINIIHVHVVWYYKFKIELHVVHVLKFDFELGEWSRSCTDILEKSCNKDYLNTKLKHKLV